jgi:hypothetical protein
MWIEQLAKDDMNKNQAVKRASSTFLQNSDEILSDYTALHARG